MAKTHMETREAMPRADLPKPYREAIGSIVTGWALLEHNIQTFVWELAGVGQEIGFYAIRDPRASDRLQMVLDLADYRGARVNPQQAKKLKKFIIDLKGHRDQFAHGVWARTKDHGWAVIVTGGHHDPNVDVEFSSRKLAPEGRPIAVSELLNINEAIDDALDAFASLRDSIRAKLPEPSAESPQL